MKVLGVIPARYGSSRFPGKPLATILGKPMIEHVYRGSHESTKLFDLVVATDDRSIYEVVHQFGGKAIMTSADHMTGTSRCAEIAGEFPEADWVINIQGDEPMIHGRLIDQMIDLISRSPEASIITLVRSMDRVEQVNNPNIVKCVFDKDFKTLYFSRSVIPYPRYQSAAVYYQHIGIYAYKKSILSELIALDPQPLEAAESLEQLRWLACGYDIRIGLTDYIAHGVDVPEDIEYVERMMVPYLRN